jgi:hypothetical protein
MKTSILIPVLGILLIVSILGAGCTNPPQPQSQTDLNAGHMTAPGISLGASADDLKNIITTSSNSSQRENGVIVLTGLSLEQQKANETVQFLKDVVTHETDENVRRTAVASIGLIRSEFPLPQLGEMNLSLEGSIHKNANFTIVVDIISKTDQKGVQIGIPHLNRSITLYSPRVVTMDLSTNHPARIRFDMAVHESGRYIIPVQYIMDFDAYDSEKGEKRVFLTVNNADGSYIIL